MPLFSFYVVEHFITVYIYYLSVLTEFKLAQTKLAH